MSEENNEEKQEVSIEEAVEEETEEKVEEERRIKKRGPGKSLKIIEEKTEGDGERLLTIRLYPRILSAPKWKRAKKAVKVLRELVTKYVKNIEDPKSGEKIRIKKPFVWISPELNELIWSRGAKNPPRRVRVRVLYKILDSEKGEVELRVFPALS
ncbi:MAG: hypothetical protein ACTSX9_01780 [Candidatus Njordarchaeales archaeon]